MPEDVEIAVFRPHFKELVTRSIPLAQNLLDHVVAVPKLKPDGSFVRLAGRVVLDLDLSQALILVQRFGIIAFCAQ